MIGKLQIIQGNVPAKANSYKTGKGNFYKDDKVKAYEKSFFAQCNLYRNAKIDKRFQLVIFVYFKSAASDLDNAAKTVLDCLQSVGAITNDNLCYGLAMEKRIDKKEPRIEFCINQIADFEQYIKNK